MLKQILYPSRKLTNYAHQVTAYIKPGVHLPIIIKPIINVHHRNKFCKKDIS